MRPTSSVRFSFNAAPSHFGLSVSRDGSYHERQNLPMQDAVVHPAERSSPCSEAEMKPARPEKQSVKPTVNQMHPKSDAVESRADRLARIKREIEDGSYDTDDKLERAVERMLGVWNDA